MVHGHLGVVEPDKGEELRYQSVGEQEGRALRSRGSGTRDLAKEVPSIRFDQHLNNRIIRS